MTLAANVDAVTKRWFATLFEAVNSIWISGRPLLTGRGDLSDFPIDGFELTSLIVKPDLCSPFRIDSLGNTMSNMANQTIHQNAADREH